MTLFTELRPWRPWSGKQAWGIHLLIYSQTKSLTHTYQYYPTLYTHTMTAKQASRWDQIQTLMNQQWLISDVCITAQVLAWHWLCSRVVMITTWPQYHGHPRTNVNGKWALSASRPLFGGIIHWTADKKEQTLQVSLGLEKLYNTWDW